MIAVGIQEYIFIMARRSVKLPIEDEQVMAFARRLNAALLKKNWNQSDLARRVQELDPEKYPGPVKNAPRHLISAYARGDNLPTDRNLKTMAKALGMKPEALIGPQAGGEKGGIYATATSGMEGMTRLVVDAQVDAETALKVLGMLREAEANMAKRKSA